jgi:predicted permease
MATFYAYLSRFTAAFSRRAWSTGLAAEFDAHLHLQIDENLRSGMTECEARRAALDKLGEPSRGVEAYRQRMSLPWLDSLIRDVRYGLRSLGRCPGFVLVAILTLALGIGANTAMFGVIYSTLLRPLPFASPDELFVLREQGLMTEATSESPVSPRNFLDWQDKNKSFSSMAAFRQQSYNFGASDGRSRPERIRGAICSYTLFGTLGIRPLVGRSFTAQEDKRGGPLVAVISHYFWQTHYGGDADITHRTVRLDGREYAIVGVMPPGFAYPAKDTVVWTSVLQSSSTEERGNHQLYVVSRLRSNSSRERAQAEMNLIAKNILASEPGALTAHTIGIHPLAEFVRKDSRLMLLTLLTAFACLLLIACVNVANLLLARGSQRTRELAVRVALGAGRGRLLRQLLTEGMLLFTGGALAGLALAYGLNAIAAHYLPLLLGPADIEIAGAAGIDWHAYLFMSLFAAMAGIATSLLPAWRSSRSGAAADISAGSGRTATGGRKRHRTQSALVAGEVAICTVLLIAAGLLTRSLFNLQRVNAGVRTENVLTAAVWLPEKQYSTPLLTAGFARQLLDKLSSTPGLLSVGAVDVLPMDGWGSDSTLEIEGRPMPAGQWIDPLYREASPTFFSTLGIPILRGRTFSLQDSEGLLSKQPHPMGAVIVSKLFADQYWPRGDPLGHVIRFGNEDGSPRFRIVGVAGDVCYRLNDPPIGTVYRSAFDGPSQGFYVVLHTATEPIALLPALRRTLRELNPDLPPFDVRTMEQIAGTASGQTRYTAFLLGSLALLALVLAAVGLYGVLSYGVARQRNEIGLRMALGSSRGKVLLHVVTQGLMPALAGLAVGLLAAFALARLLASLLYGVAPRDLSTFLVVPLVLSAVALLACFVPAWRATRVDPIDALRCD